MRGAWPYVVDPSRASRWRRERHEVRANVVEQGQGIAGTRPAESTRATGCCGSGCERRHRSRPGRVRTGRCPRWARCRQPCRRTRISTRLSGLPDVVPMESIVGDVRDDPDADPRAVVDGTANCPARHVKPESKAANDAGRPDEKVNRSPSCKGSWPNGATSNALSMPVSGAGRLPLPLPPQPAEAVARPGPPCRRAPMPTGLTQLPRTRDPNEVRPAMPS